MVINSRLRSCSLPVTIAAFIACIVVGLTPSLAISKGDTLRTYVVGGAFVFYRDTTIKRSIARFDLVSPAYLKGIDLLLGGSGNNEPVQVRVLGNEAGLPGPSFGHDLIEPRSIRKSREGIERFHIDLPGEILLRGTQFFISVESLEKGVYLLSDKVEKAAVCQTESERFTGQIFETESGRLQYGKYGFVVDALIEYVNPVARTNFKDVTLELGLFDSATVPATIAASDIDNDRFVDISVGGRVFRNHGGKIFKEMSLPVAMERPPTANVFIDIDNDGFQDLVFIDVEGEKGRGLYVYRYDGMEFLRPRYLECSPIDHPTSFSIADGDGDGYLDILIGTTNDTDTTTAVVLLMNDRKGGFHDQTKLLGHADSLQSQTSMVRWVDIDMDGRLDILTGDPLGSTSLWLNTEQDGFTLIGSQKYASRFPSYVVGSDWTDIDGVAGEDVVINRAVNTRSHVILADSGTAFYSINDGGRAGKEYHHPDIGYLHGQAGVSVADINNDGRIDILRSTASPCRFAELYIQGSNGMFTDETFDYGLARTNSGPDALWLDYNNDGRLDLATFIGGQLKVFKNIGDYGNNYVDIQLQGQIRGDEIGGRVVVYSGDEYQEQTVSSGRGLLMQGPMRLHFGLGQARAVDSVVVHWSGDTVHTERFMEVEAGQISTLVRGEGAQTNQDPQSALEVSPNPFSSSLSIHYQIPDEAFVTLDIYSTIGQHVIRLIDDRLSLGDHKTVWNGVDGNGEPAPPGVYIVRLRSGSSETTTRVTLQK